MKIFVETERLILREMHATDDIGMFELDSNPEVHKYLGNKPIDTMEQSKATIENVRKQYLENGIGRWSVVEKSSGDFIGWSGLKLMTTVINNRTNFYDVGYRLIPRFWGKGYATESAKASIEYGFTKMNVNEIIGIANIENIKSRRALEKSGLSFKEQFIFPFWNTTCDWLSITKEEWMKEGKK
ncbi:MAG TPA: GNAT family N-acetyltransferase [Saprospiraceae bacterium]|nr:GNAT family N-acetyltransferase [Saprospiraceae bacterium]